MKVSIRLQIWLGFGLALLIMSGIGLVAYTSTTRLVITAGWVNHSHEVLQALEAVLADLSDAETGQRGYLLTSQDRYLEPYQTARLSIDARLQRLRSLTRDNRAQQQRLETLQPLVTARLGLLQEGISLDKTQGLEAALQLLRTNRGQNVMDRIRQVVRAMEDDETTLLQQREQQAQAGARRALTVIVGGSLLAVLLLAGAGAIITRSLTRRLEVEAALHSSERRLFQLMEALPVGIFALDRQGKVYYANHMAYQILGQEIGTDTLPEEFAAMYHAYVAETEQVYPMERLPLVRALAGERSVVDDLEIHYAGQQR